MLSPPEVLVVLTVVEKEGKKDENGDLLSDRIEGDFLTWKLPTKFLVGNYRPFTDQKFGR